MASALNVLSVMPTRSKRVDGRTFPCAPKALLICDPTLRQTKPREDPRPQCAFKESVLSVSCNSHQVSQLAAFFIDPRTE